MISIILFIYVGVQINALWWYYALLGFLGLVKILNAGIKLGEKVGEHK